MGFLSRLISGRRGWEPPVRPDCGCREHVDDVRHLTVPYDPEMGTNLDNVTVGDLVDCGAIEAAPARSVGHDVEEGYHWVLWMRDETRAHFSREAPRSLVDALARRRGVSAATMVQPEEYLLDAPRLCEPGVLAVAARALLDPGVRSRPSGGGADPDR